jgi:hypothetical protein
MEEIEVPTEQLQEEIHHHAESGKERWISKVALSSALLAVFAAVSALLAGDHANEAMIEQIQASNQWSYYQAKGIKSAVVAMKAELLSTQGKKLNEADQEKILKYKEDQEKISDEAQEKEKLSKSHLTHHQIYARGVTMFQVAIGVAAISVLTRRRRFWIVGMAFGLIGLIFLIQGLLLPI